MALFGWLSDLVAQLLYADGNAMPQRRKWNLRGDAWTAYDDSDEERLDIWINGDAVIRQTTTTSLLILGDDTALDDEFQATLLSHSYQKSSGMRLVGDVTSNNGAHSAVASSTIASAKSRFAALTIDEPDVILIMLGRDELDSQDSASDIAAELLALILAIRVSWAHAYILLGDPNRWYAPATDAAAKTVIADALYPLLSPVVALLPRCDYVPSGSLLDEDQIDDSALPTTEGYRRLATAFARAIQNALPPLYGLERPRPFIHQAHLGSKLRSMSLASTATLSIPTPNTEAADAAIAFWYYPTGDFDQELMVAKSTDSFEIKIANRKLIVKSGNATPPDIESEDVFAPDQWHRIVLVLEIGAMRVYVNGRLVAQDETGDHSWDLDDPIIFGDASSRPGYVCDVIASDAIPTEDQIANDYYDCQALPRNVISRHRLVGGSLADDMGGAAATNGLVFDSYPPLLPGEKPYEYAWLPDTDTALAYWSADVGADPENGDWYDQARDGVLLAQNVAGQAYSVIAGEDWAGQRAVRFASQSDRADGQRFFTSGNDLDELTDYGFLVCVAFKVPHLSTNSQCLISNKDVDSALGLGFDLTMVMGTTPYAQITIGDGTNVVVDTSSNLAIRAGAVELLTFRFTDEGGTNDWRGETQLGATTGNRSNPAVTAACSALVVGARSQGRDQIYRGDLAQIVIYQDTDDAVLDAIAVNWRTYAERKFRSYD